MNRQTKKVSVFIVFAVFGIVLLKNIGTEDCLRNRDKDDGVLAYTPSGQKAFIAHHETHHGKPMIYLCESK